MTIHLQCKEKNPALYLPEKVKVKYVERFTELEKFLHIELSQRPLLGHHPGQFVQVLIPGIGEGPISVSSPPSDDNNFDICVRAVGDVTNKIVNMEVGDEFFIRGPFGQGFDEDILKSMEGKHIVCIGGGIGCVPLRSLINHLIKQPKKYKNISVLIGCKTPKDRMYVNELMMMHSHGDNIELIETVDNANEEWKGRVGLITSLIPLVEMDPENTIAAVIGPPIMYKFVMKELLDRNIKKENIYLSLERRMRCGVGKCGHCQMEDSYVCQDGPVYRYSDIEHNEEAL